MNIQQLFEKSIHLKASDLHISPDLQPLCRVNGNLHSLSEFPVLDAATTQNMIFSLMTKEQQDAFNTKLQLDFTITTDPLGSFRINAFRQSHGIAAAFRIIPALIPTMEEIGIPHIFNKLLGLTSGLILVTGATGSGKSTSLAAMVDHINSNQSRHIITVEDPIEFAHQSKKSLISQRQIYRDATSFEEALHAVLREDPDVILIGEMRDLDTIRLALTAAETGHLVLGTLHTSTAARAVNRILDIFPSGEKNMIRHLLSESIQAILCQTLIKRATGGRVAAFETMVGTVAIRNCIREDKFSQMYSVIQTGSHQGMCTMEQFIKSLVDKNIISPDSAAATSAMRNIIEGDYNVI